MGIQAPKYNTVANQGYLNPLQKEQLTGEQLRNYAQRKENEAKDINNTWGQSSDDGQKHTISIGGKEWVVRNGLLVDPSTNKPATKDEIDSMRKSDPDTINKIYGKDDKENTLTPPS